MYEFRKLIDDRLQEKIRANIVYNYNLNDVYIINQNGELFKKADSSKKSWRHYINGGMVTVLNSNYFASYNFDFGNCYFRENLVYFSFDDKAGINFKDFIMKIRQGDNNKFIWANGLEVNNIKTKLKDIKRVQIISTIVDNTLVKDVLTIFPKLKDIEFISCRIKKECHFNCSYNGDITFKNSIIESFESFQNSNNSFKFFNSDILNYSNCDVMSKELYFSDSNVDFYQLFLKTNFIELEDLLVHNIPKYDQYGGNYQKNFKNSFFYLPYSAPKLLNLRIEGSVDNLDFITKLKFLNKVSIVSSSGDMLKEYLDINDKNKLNDLIRRNQEEIEIKKILSGETNNQNVKYYATESEIARILRLNDIYKILSFTNEEKKALVDKYLHGTNYINFILDDSFIKLDGYYQNYYDHLLFTQLDKKRELIEGLKLQYQYNALFYENNYTKIVKAKKALFYIDGRPIILKRSSKPIKTIEEAKDFMKDKKITSNKEDLSLEYLKILKRVVSTLEKDGNLEDIDMNDFLFDVNEEGGFSLSIIYKDLISRLNSGHEIFYKLYHDNEKWQYKQHLNNLFSKCQKAFTDMIDSRFKEFTKEELLLIGKQLLGNNFLNPYLNIEIINIGENQLLESINNKCNGNYFKMLKIVDTLNEIETKVFNKRYIIKKAELEKIKTLSLKEK